MYDLKIDSGLFDNIPRYNKDVTIHDQKQRIKQLEDALRGVSEMVSSYVTDYMGEESETLDVAEFYYHKFDSLLSRNKSILETLIKERDA